MAHIEPDGGDAQVLLNHLDAAPPLDWLTPSALAA